VAQGIAPQELPQLAVVLALLKMLTLLMEHQTLVVEVVVLEMLLTLQALFQVLVDLEW
jgi:hypothetical protein